VVAVFAESLHSGADYIFLTGEGRHRADPVSRWLPGGIHGPSRVVDPSAFPWSDQNWRGIPLKEYVINELHTGTFTRDGFLFAGHGPSGRRRM